MIRINFRLTPDKMWLINIIVLLLGALCIFGSHNMQPSLLRSIVDALGTSLFATGLIGGLGLIFVKVPISKGVEVACDSRNDLPRSLKNRKYSAKKIDILGYSLTGCMREIATDRNHRMLFRLLTQKVRMRLIFVHPDAPVLEQRAMEDGYLGTSALRTRQIESVEQSVVIFREMAALYHDLYENENRVPEPSRLGTIEIRMIDSCPHITVDRADNSILWGLYLSSNPGLNSPMFHVRMEDQPKIFDQLKNHFYGLLRNPTLNGEDYCLVRMMVGIVTPSLNGDLAESLLGVEKMDELLGKNWRVKYADHLFTSAATTPAPSKRHFGLKVNHKRRRRLDARIVELR